MLIMPEEAVMAEGCAAPMPCFEEDEFEDSVLCSGEDDFDSCDYNCNKMHGSH